MRCTALTLSLGSVRRHLVHVQFLGIVGVDIRPAFVRRHPEMLEPQQEPAHDDDDHRPYEAGADVSNARTACFDHRLTKNRSPCRTAMNVIIHCIYVT